MIHQLLTIPSAASEEGASPLPKTMIGAMAGLPPSSLDPPMRMGSNCLERDTTDWRALTALLSFSNVNSVSLLLVLLHFCRNNYIVCV